MRHQPSAESSCGILFLEWTRNVWSQKLSALDLWIDRIEFCSLFLPSGIGNWEWIDRLLTLPPFRWSDVSWLATWLGSSPPPSRSTGSSTETCFGATPSSPSASAYFSPGWLVGLVVQASPSALWGMVTTNSYDQWSHVVFSDFSSSWSSWPCWLRLAESLPCPCSTRRSVSRDLTLLSAILRYRFDKEPFIDRGHFAHGMERGEPGIKKYHSKTGEISPEINFTWLLPLSSTAVAGRDWRISLGTVSPSTTVAMRRLPPQSVG